MRIHCWWEGCTFGSIVAGSILRPPPRLVGKVAAKPQSGPLQISLSCYASQFELNVLILARIADRGEMARVRVAAVAVGVAPVHPAGWDASFDQVDEGKAVPWCEGRRGRNGRS